MKIYIKFENEEVRNMVSVSNEIDPDIGTAALDMFAKNTNISYGEHMNIACSDKNTIEFNMSSKLFTFIMGKMSVIFSIAKSLCSVVMNMVNHEIGMFIDEPVIIRDGDNNEEESKSE